MKHVLLTKEVWKKLHELKLKWEKKNLSEVIETLLKNAEGEEKHD